MSWYHDDLRTTYVRTYSSQSFMRADIEAATRFGWQPQVAAVGRRLVVTYTRTEESRLHQRASNTVAALQQHGAKLEPLQNDITQIRINLGRCMQCARTSLSNPIALERATFTLARSLISRMQQANRQRNQLLVSLALAQDAYRQAAQADVELPPPTLDLDAELISLRAIQDRDVRRLELYTALVFAQGRVHAAVWRWQQAVAQYLDCKRQFEEIAPELASSGKQAKTPDAAFDLDAGVHTSGPTFDGEPRQGRRRVDASVWASLPLQPSTRILHELSLAVTRKFPQLLRLEQERRQRKLDRWQGEAQTREQELINYIQQRDAIYGQLGDETLAS